MHTSLILTVIADDKPGIVEQIAAPITAAGANWEESRMARLAGKFAGLLRISVDPARADALAAHLAALGNQGFTIAVERSTDMAPAALRTLHLELIGNDRPGIIRDISRVLARHGVNIDALETAVASAPMSGDVLFRAHAGLRAPATLSLETMRTELEALAGELMVDLTLDTVAEAADG
jgi:glycine cleavage system regulatory protein